MAIFIIDTNFFIQAHRSIYPLDVATGFWHKVKQLVASEKIVIIDKVKAEIFFNDDELKRWLENNISDNVYKLTESQEVLTRYSQVVNWANSKNDHYLPQAITEFLELKNADAWLVAYALSINEEKYIVTQEVSAPNKLSKIKIPDVCDVFSINYLNTIGMFRKLDETF